MNETHQNTNSYLNNNSNPHQSNSHSQIDISGYYKNSENEKELEENMILNEESNSKNISFDSSIDDNINKINDITDKNDETIDSISGKKKNYLFLYSF